MLGEGDGRDQKGFEKFAAALTLKGEPAPQGRRQASRQWGRLVQMQWHEGATDTELLTADTDTPTALVCLEELLLGNCVGLPGRPAFQGGFMLLVVRMPTLLLITRSLVSSIKQAPKGFLPEVVN